MSGSHPGEKQEVVKPLLQERTRRKIQVLQGRGKEELLKVMDYASLPHFCRKEDSRSWRHHHAAGNTENCFSFNHVFHQQLYNYIKQQAIFMESISPPMRQGSFYVDIPEPDPDDAKIAKTIEVEFLKIGKSKWLYQLTKWSCSEWALMTSVTSEPLFIC